jgi:hypothetical protein
MVRKTVLAASCLTVALTCVVAAQVRHFVFLAFALLLVSLVYCSRGYARLVFEKMLP